LAQILFQELDWLITRMSEWGWGAPTDTGKNPTLLKILAGKRIARDGTIAQQSGIQSGYLPQDGLSLSGRTVLPSALSV